jgi:Helicase conserved C-terminal domain
MEYLTKKKGVWTSDPDQPANFATLSEAEQEAVDTQLNAMIRSKYTDIHYNAPNLRSILVELSQQYAVNPFDNAVVIIDEAHNLANRIVNKLEKQGKKQQALSDKPTSLLLYETLMSASNARIVLLSGTPIINTPSEAAVLFNMLRGYIKTWTFPIHVQTDQRVTTETIRGMLETDGINAMDYLEYSQNKLMVTRNPFGFINNKTGVCDVSTKKGIGKTRRIEGGKGARKTRKNKPKNRYANGFVEEPTNISSTEGFAGDTADRPEETPLIYVLAPHLEYTDENEPHMGGAGAEGESDPNYRGLCLDETGNISDRMFVSRIKAALTKNNLEVVGQPRSESYKCLPDKIDDFLEQFVDMDRGGIIKNDDVFARRTLGLTSYFKSAQESLLPAFVPDASGNLYHIVKTDMSSHQFRNYASIRKDEYEQEVQMKKNKRRQQKGAEGAAAPGGAEALYANMESTYRIYSRTCCNFSWPNPPARPDTTLVKRQTERDAEADVIEGGEGEDEEADADDSAQDMDVVAAMDALNKPQFLGRDHLETYSPKFAAILERITHEKHQGLHLLYSSFRTLEGIGILRLILMQNGFEQFPLKKTPEGEWDIDPLTPGKPRFILYTGTESTEEKEILRNIYNGSWDAIPPTITKKLEEFDQAGKKNTMGNIIKVIMITASGAEGINLKNTRYVHIVEPYWNMVRIDQVVGRARRICSHEELPEELRTVQVFIYLSVFSDQQKANREYLDLMNTDTSRFDQVTPVTTDETLYEISTQKNNINQQILTVIKQTSVDCALYSDSTNMVCYGADMGRLSDRDNEFLSYPTLDQDKQVKTQVVKQREVRVFRDVTIQGKKYHMDENTKEIFSHDVYMRWKYDNTIDLVPLGKLVKEGRGYKIVS